LKNILPIFASKWHAKFWELKTVSRISVKSLWKSGIFWDLSVFINVCIWCLNNASQTWIKWNPVKLNFKWSPNTGNLSQFNLHKPNTSLLWLQKLVQSRFGLDRFIELRYNNLDTGIVLLR
jgi:hypothetical protein